MTKRISIASAILTVLATILALARVVAAPALAGPTGDGGKSESK